MKLLNKKMPSNQIQTIRINAEGQPVGRVASRVAHLLTGKATPHFERHLVTPVKVIVFNAAKARFSGTKETSKRYTRYSGYPGGLKSLSVSKVRTKNPSYPLEKAIYGMMSKNRLLKPRLKQLTIHPYAEK